MAAEALPPITRGSDPATASNWRTWRAAHYDWSATVDPFKRTLQGVVAVHVAPVAVGALADGEASTSARTHVVLDSHACLAVSRVDLHAADGGGDGESLEFETRDFTEFGTALRVALPAHAVAAGAAHSEAHASASEDVVGDVAFQLRITYAMKSAGPAVTWLSAAQTAGKELPYAYSIGQAVCNRGLLPCQDTPATRVTFSASLRVPAPLVALVATDETPGVEEDGRPTGVDVDGGDGEHPLREFRYRMTQSVPIYLLAIAVGDLSSARIGPRSRVWCEPSGLEAAQFEFGEGEIVERYVAAGEELFGEYRWKRYDVLVMPPAFAYGGMESESGAPAARTPALGRRLTPARARRPVPDVHQHGGRVRRPEPRRRRGARDHALLVREPGDQRVLERVLPERGLHHVRPAPHLGQGARRRARRAGDGDGPRVARDCSGEHAAPAAASARADGAGPGPGRHVQRVPVREGLRVRLLAAQGTPGAEDSKSALALTRSIAQTAGCSDDDFDRIFLRQYVEKHASTCVMSEDMLVSHALHARAERACALTSADCLRAWASTGLLL